MKKENQSASKDNDFTIECKDIILREYRVEDLDEFHELTWQPDISEFLPGWNVPKAQREDWFINYELKENKQFLDAVSEGREVGQLRLRLGIISKVTGEFIGWICTGMKEELPPPNREIMYAISKDHRGKGYTTQAVQGLISYLFAYTSVEELNAVALINNMPSNRVIQKCRFDFLGIIEIENETYNYYKIRKNFN
ncbi:GNAT family N-acetyltransferase [Paenibacillus planticolens]|uniref:GNAT family N-acetyltransferase n=1 Tax=Paenibacillus planticolens TaxID=2654976 RepID=A0ABX1ZFK6_9BACL|nr:GNAT family N-acetyltransferase [Paenibacillus planticolens]NOU98865.1 GNAT family N-acetyltransferase [Paenibacillus planticolens]